MGRRILVCGAVALLAAFGAGCGPAPADPGTGDPPFDPAACKVERETLEVALEAARVEGALPQELADLWPTWIKHPPSPEWIYAIDATSPDGYTLIGRC